MTEIKDLTDAELVAEANQYVFGSGFEIREGKIYNARHIEIKREDLIKCLMKLRT